VPFFFFFFFFFLTQKNQTFFFFSAKPRMGIKFRRSMLFLLKSHKSCFTFRPTR
jgi:hypothetical protein